MLSSWASQSRKTNEKLIFHPAEGLAVAALKRHWKRYSFQLKPW